MADQKRWFKLWHSALSDDALQSLPPDKRWAWAAFGAHTKVHGHNGTITVSPANAALAAGMGVELSSLKETIQTLPHVSVEEGLNRNGNFSVTWHNWKKYQEDSTGAERIKSLRRKRRGEEKRREENKKTPPLMSPPTQFQIPASIVQALDRAPVLGKTVRLRTPQFWQAQVRANPGVNFAQEILKAEAYLAARPGRYHEFARFLSNWLKNAERPDEAQS